MPQECIQEVPSIDVRFDDAATSLLLLTAWQRIDVKPDLNVGIGPLPSRWQVPATAQRKVDLPEPLVCKPAAFFMCSPRPRGSRAGGLGGVTSAGGRTTAGTAAGPLADRAQSRR